jgi:hypothetical protein
LYNPYSANEYLFSKNKRYINNDYKISKLDFIKYFGTFKNDKKRHSWSGTCVPKYNIYNNCKQILNIDTSNNICIYYCYNKDNREDKNNLPEFLQQGDKELLIAIWLYEKFKDKIDNKFNKKGFFICKKENNVYNKICFGKPFNFDFFIENIKNKIIFFDSGMYEGNNRNYSHFRSNINFWNKLIIDEY